MYYTYSTHIQTHTHINGLFISVLKPSFKNYDAPLIFSLLMSKQSCTKMMTFNGTDNGFIF